MDYTNYTLLSYWVCWFSLLGYQSFIFYSTRYFHMDFSPCLFHFGSPICRCLLIFVGCFYIIIFFFVLVDMCPLSINTFLCFLIIIYQCVLLLMAFSVGCVRFKNLFSYTTLVLRNILRLYMIYIHIVNDPCAEF